VARHLGDKSHQGQEIFFLQSIQTVSLDHAASYSTGTKVLYQGYTWQGTELTTQLHLLLSLGMNGAILLLPLYAFVTLKRITLPCPFPDNTVGILEYMALNGTLIS